MADCDKIKPSLIKELEAKNVLTIIANHYGSSDMRFGNIKLPKIELYNLSEQDSQQCLATLKHKKSYIQYIYSQNGIKKDKNINLLIITPKVYDKKIGPKFIKYITLSHFSMIGTINKQYIHELEKLKFL